MKKIILTAAVLYSLASFGQLMAWDTTASKYLPLQVGNVWVYDCTSMGYIYQNHYYCRYKITGTLDTMGHRYYVYERTLVWIYNQNGANYYQLLAMGSMQPVRIDSATMNIFVISSLCSSFEFLFDSLKADIHTADTVCRPGFDRYFSSCDDTVPYMIFNTSVSSKKFSEIHHYGNFTRYAKGIGIVTWDFGYQMNSAHDVLKGCVVNSVLRGDTSMIVGLVNIGTEIPEKFSLYQNYPNPFNPVTKIKFDVPGAQITNLCYLAVYDALGKQVSTLVNEMLHPGTYEIEWDATNYPSGVYIYKLHVGDYSEARRMILLK